MMRAPAVVLVVLAVPAVLMAALIGLDAAKHEGYRPDSGDLLTAALTWGAAAAGLAAAAGRRFRLAAVVGGAVLFTVVLVVANDLVYRYVVPLPGDLRQPVSPWPEAAFPLVAALIGYGARLLHARFAPAETRKGAGGRAAARVRRGRVVVAGVVLVLGGAFAVPEYTRIALELATVRFSTGAEARLGGPPAGLTAGRYALYGLWGDTRGDCPLTDRAGRRIDVEPPAVRFTDNSDSIVSTMLGTFTLDEPTEIVGECRGDQFWIAGPPMISGPLGPVLSTPPGVLSVLGALPGVLVIGLFLARVRENSARASNPGHRPNG